MNLDQNIVEKVIEMFNDGKNTSEAQRYISKATGKKRSQAWDDAKSIKVAYLKTDFKDHEPEVDHDLHFEKDYIFNREDKTYVFLTEKSIGKNIVLSDEKVQAIIKSYSNFDGEPDSINQVASKFNIHRNIVIQILKILRITHDSLPVTDEVLASENEESILADLIQDKRFSVQQALQKRTWKDTVNKAKQWDKLQELQINPMKEFFDGFTIQPLKVVKAPKTKAKQSIILGLSDTHFGECASEVNQFEGRAWTIEDTAKAITAYEKKIIPMQGSYRECHVVSLGDILDSITGETDKGTVLATNPIGIEQYEKAITSIAGFLTTCLSVFPKVSVHGVGGNHDNFGDYALFRYMEALFSGNKRISFNISTSRWNVFEAENALFLFEHGASHKYKAKVPSSHPAREQYVSKLMLRNKEFRSSGKHRYFLMGDLHHVETKEYANFEFFQFSSLVGGNEYSNNLNLMNRPRQNGLTVTEEGVIAFHNFFLD